MTKPTRLDYCQYLLSTPINYTLTHFADPCMVCSLNISENNSNRLR